ncbi:F-box domain-containing protein [Mycena indigotica]|uniref:F-box domain-containing protein n=1 Tax=Mycena indigotica TaxID=2126181 RepID=A0A8H6SCI0_9AGAR|nr:F-box domain-containing protein [Mycena indigotica]KAF7297020.1 F-box domain-containing protein [Mycena indigotica]
MSIASLLREQIADIDSQLPALRQQLADLEARQAQFVAQLSEIKFPVLTLPHEVTLYIWSFVLEPWNPVYEYSEYVPAQPALVLASVCRVWRQLALSTTELWSTLIVSWPHTGPVYSILLASLFLKRSGSIRPLDVDFRFIGRPEHIQSIQVEEAFNTLKPVEGRLQRLRISYDGQGVDSAFLDPKILPDALPKLQVLDLGSFRLSDKTNNISTRSTPRLSYLRVESAQMARRLGLSPCNLVTLVLSCVEPVQTAEMLSAAPRLETLHLGKGRSEESVTGASRRRLGGDLCLVHLRELSCLHADWAELIDRLSLPRLESAILGYSLDTRAAAAFTLCIRCNPQPPLRELTIRGIAVGATWRAIVCLPPTVSELTLDALPWDFAHTAQFCQDVRTRLLLPGLKHLRVENWACNYEDPATVATVGLWVDTVASRWIDRTTAKSVNSASPESAPPPVRLKSFFLGLSNSDDSDWHIKELQVLDPLRKMKDEGLDVRVFIKNRFTCSLPI